MKRFLAMLLAVMLFTVACGDSDTSSEDDEPAPQPTSAAANIDSNPDDTSADDTPDVAAIVNGTPISMATFEAELANARTNSNAATDDALRATILDELIDQVLIAQYAEQNDIVIDDAVVQAEIDALNALADEAGYTLAEVMQLPPDTSSDIVEQKVYEGLLTQAVADDVVANADVVTTRVRARHILVRDESLAIDILQQLNDGEDFVTLAETYSIDSSTALAGGDLGWIAPGDLLQPVVEQIVFDIPASTRYPDPVPSDLGWHIIEVLERDETQSLTDEQLSQQRILIFQTWLAEQRRAATIERFIS